MNNTEINLALAKEMLRYNIAAAIPSFMWGPPGVGKSESVYQLAEAEDYALIDFRAPLRDAVDMRGLPLVDAKAGTTKWLPPDELPNEKRHGKKGILFLDELNAAAKDVQVACYGLVLDRKLGEYTLPDGWHIIAAGNRQEDRAAAVRMPSALANRFSHLNIGVNHEQWIRDYALDNCDPLVVGFIRARPELLHAMDADADETTRFPTPRTWERVSRICNVPDHIRYQQVASNVGPAAASEFEAFVKTVKDLPSIEDIIADPKRTRVPDEPSALFAVATALGKYANRDNFKNILIYAERLGREYHIIVAMDATARDEGLVKTKAYTNFVTENKDLQIGNWKAA